MTKIDEYKFERHTVLFNEYSATGEGVTVCILVTRIQDVEESRKKFIDTFGAFYAIGLQVGNDQNRKIWTRFIPTVVIGYLEAPCNTFWSGMFHMNCS